MRCPPSHIIEEYLDGDLPRQQRLQIEEHLRQCTSCWQLCAAERRLGNLLRTQLRQRAPAEFRNRVLENLLARETAPAVPDWLWSLGLGLVLIAAGFFSARLGRHFLPLLWQRISTVAETIGLIKSWEALRIFWQNDGLSQLPTDYYSLLLNFSMAGIILCVALWQVVKALRR